LNNPAYLLQAYFPKTVFFSVELLFTPLFHGFFYFSVLVMLDSIIRKGDSLVLSRAGPKVAIALAKWFCLFLQTWRRLSTSFSGRPTMGYDGVGWLLGVGELAALYILLKTLMYRDSRAAAKVDAYIQVFGLIVVSVGKIFAVFGGTAVEWTFQFVIFNPVVLLMGWLHLPVEAPLEPDDTEGHVLNPEQVLEPQDVNEEPEEEKK
jgi:hypothetical protein